jgi:transcriptional regulator
MYLPPHFNEDRLDVLHGAMREAGLATLVTLGSDGLVASHLPMLLEPGGRYGTLVGHVSRGNPQWRDVADLDALAIFLGPDAYISPSWYATKQETGKVVPTWNYVAVHAYGRVRFFDEPERLLALVTRLTEKHEGGRASPWAVSDAPAAFVESMLKGFVGFELPIERLEGKWKMSQNRPAADRAGVVEGLRAGDRPEEHAVAEIVAANAT